MFAHRIWGPAAFGEARWVKIVRRAVRSAKHGCFRGHPGDFQSRSASEPTQNSQIGGLARGWELVVEFSRLCTVGRFSPIPILAPKSAKLELTCRLLCRRLRKTRFLRAIASIGCLYGSQRTKIHADYVCRDAIDCIPSFTAHIPAAWPSPAKSRLGAYVALRLEPRSARRIVWHH